MTRDAADRPGRSRRQPREADLDAFRSAAGGWADVDVDRLIADVRAGRQATPATGGEDARPDPVAAQLLQALRRPALFAPHEAPFWDDPHIARQMLVAHLDPNTDAASRRPETIERTVTWLVAQLGLRPEQRVLDLGCGPGLYAQRLARLGLDVTGVDLSAGSIEYARRAAAEAGLAIEYRCQDYRALDAEAAFDAALLIYFDFGVLPDADRDTVLARVHRALRSGGAFVFDVVTPQRPRPPAGTRTWNCRDGGFWRPGPYLELTEHFFYAEAEVELRQMAILDATGDLTVYRVWEHLYARATLAPVLERQGFVVESWWSDLTGTPYSPDSPALGVVARRV